MLTKCWPHSTRGSLATFFSRSKFAQPWTAGTAVIVATVPQLRLSHGSLLKGSCLALRNQHFYIWIQLRHISLVMRCTHYKMLAKISHHEIFSAPKKITTNANEFTFTVNLCAFFFFGSEGTKPELRSTCFLQRLLPECLCSFENV